MLGDTVVLYQSIKSRKWGSRLLRLGLFAWILGVVILLDQGCVAVGSGRARTILRFIGDEPCAVEIYTLPERDVADVESAFRLKRRMPGMGFQSDVVHKGSTGFEIEFPQGVHRHGELFPRVRYGRSSHMAISGYLSDGKPFLKCIALPPKDRAMPPEIVIHLP